MKYRISGVWKNSKNVITHYALHTVGKKETSKAIKTSKANVIKLLENNENYAVTWIWNYTTVSWNIGEKVKVVQGKNGKYLRSNPDTTKTDNLNNLLDYDWIAFLK